MSNSTNNNGWKIGIYFWILSRMEGSHSFLFITIYIYVCNVSIIQWDVILTLIAQNFFILLKISLDWYILMDMIMDFKASDSVTISNWIYWNLFPHFKLQRNHRAPSEFSSSVVIKTWKSNKSSRSKKILSWIK